MRVICFRDRVVALAGEWVVLAPSIAVLEDDHPERRLDIGACPYVLGLPPIPQISRRWRAAPAYPVCA